MRVALIAVMLCLAGYGDKPDRSVIYATPPFVHGEAAMSGSHRDALVAASTAFVDRHGYSIRSTPSIQPMILVIYDRIPAELNIVVIDRGEGERPLLVSATAKGGSPSDEQRRVVEEFLAEIRPLVGPISQLK